MLTENAAKLERALRAQGRPGDADIVRVLIDAYEATEFDLKRTKETVARQAQQIAAWETFEARTG